MIVCFCLQINERQMKEIILSGRAEETILECVNKCGSCETTIREMCRGNNGLSKLSTKCRKISSRKK